MVARESKRAKRNLVHARAILIKLSASARTAAARTTSGSATARSATRIAGRPAGSGGRPGVIVRSGGRFGIIVGSRRLSIIVRSRRSGVIVRCRRAIIGRSRLGSIVGRRSSRGSAVRRRSMMMIRGCRLVRDAVGVKTSTLEAVATHIGPIYLRMGKIEKISRVVTVHEEYPSIRLPFHGTIEIFDGQILLILPVAQHNWLRWS